MPALQETAYAFHLDDIRGHHLYYRTISLFCGTLQEHGRDERKAYPVSVHIFQKIMTLLGETVRFVRDEAEIKVWQARFGWALIPSPFAENFLGPFIGRRVCVRSAIGLFWDVEIPRNRATSRRVKKETRQRVLDRDGHRCIECGKYESDGVTLTMHHVIPYSRGGETAEGNLVTLCKPCNEGYDNEYHPHLFALAGLDHGWDPDLLDRCLASNTEARVCALGLSQNILVSRCSIGERKKGHSSP